MKTLKSKAKPRKAQAARVTKAQLTRLADRLSVAADELRQMLKEHGVSTEVAA